MDRRKFITASTLLCSASTGLMSMSSAQAQTTDGFVERGINVRSSFKVGIVLFEGVVLLDAIGPYDVLMSLKTLNIVPHIQCDMCAMTSKVKDYYGTTIRADKVRRFLGNYDLIIIPGGPGLRSLMNNRTYLKWLRTCKDAKIIASVCAGTALLGATGLIRDRIVTTHPAEGTQQLVAQYCKQVVSDRIVYDHGILTSAGVTSGIDMAFYLIRRLLGEKAAADVATLMDYPHYKVKALEI